MNAPLFPSTPEQILLVPVDQLVASDLNVRKTGGQSISELAASIRAHGLLQNLTAVATKSTSRGKVVDKFHVVAGGRRLRAIQQLIEEGHLPADYQVPVRIVGEDDAVAASLAENTVREAMNPADQVLAFKAMADDNMSPAEIADAFGVSEVTVQRRLALANVAPALLDAYRDGEVTLEKLQALALTDDHKVQLEVWDQVKGRSWQDADDIKRLIAGDDETASDNPLAKFVTVEAYEAAGGPVRRDLFSDEGECFLLDSALLERLAMAKLQAEADKLATRDGVKWVDVHLRWNWGLSGKYRDCKTSQREPRAGEAMTLRKLRAALEKISKEQDGLTEDEYYEQADELEAQRLAAEEAVESFEDTLAFPVGPDAQRAGAVVTMNDDGQLWVKLHQLRRAEDGKSAPGDEDGDDDQGDDDDDETPAPAPAASGLPRSMIQRLTAHRTAAGQAVLATNPDQAVRVLAAHMVSNIWGQHDNMLQTVVRHVNPAKHAEEVSDSKAAATLQAAEKAITEMLPYGGGCDALEILDWMQEQPMERVLKVLALCTAYQLDTTTDMNAGHNDGAMVIEALEIDMADWWEPTRATWFDHVNVARIEATVADACDDAQVQALSKLKGKDAIAGRAEQMLAGKRWLPDVLKGE